MDELNFFWKHIGQAILHESVSLAAANLHDRPGLRDRIPDLCQDFFNQALAAVFIQDCIH